MEVRPGVGTRCARWVLLLAVAACANTEASLVDDSVRVLAWNVSGRCFREGTLPRSGPWCAKRRRTFCCLTK